MNFTGLFLLFGGAVVFAWQGNRRWALILFAIGLVLTFPLYLHHATTLLPLSF